jgi:hypothetical protein
VNNAAFTTFDSSNFQTVLSTGYITHGNRNLKNTNDVSFDLTTNCNKGDVIKVQGILAIHKGEFFYDIVGEMKC